MIYSDDSLQIKLQNAEYFGFLPNWVYLCREKYGIIPLFKKVRRGHMGKSTLTDYINDSEFIDKMNMAFSDLRADYELSMDVDKEKISELEATHVDVKNQLSDLISYSLSSSGTVSGLRGTGKTHLMLLARHKINENCYAGKAHGIFCVYLNVKRLNLPENFDQELFNRVFSVFVYNEIAKQLIGILDQFRDSTLFQKIFDLFNIEKRDQIKNIDAALIKLMEFQGIAREGNSKFMGLSSGTIDESSEFHSLVELSNALHSGIGIAEGKLKGELSTDWALKNIDEVSKRLQENNTYLNYLNTGTIREELVALMKLLKIKGITFYVDEWEKISYNPNLQKYLSFYIDRILDDPIYCWVSVVPYRGSLYHLDKGADLQHLIDLDENLVYENSDKDRELCISYFRRFVNNRLLYYFNDPSITVNLLFNNNQNFEKLVLASMGNSRDFGTMLLKCWSEFRAYRTAQLPPGRPYQYISEHMVILSIKNNGEKKISNLNNNPNALKAWNDLERFCITKRSSHIAIEENRTNIDAMSRPEFSDLIYHRLLHLRKRHVPAKDTSIENKLSIYALNYSSTYDLHSNERKIQFIRDYNSVHDRVRRYIYDPTLIIGHIQIQEGEIFPCMSCGGGIIIGKMIAAWESNTCPFCGSNIRNV